MARLGPVVCASIVLGIIGVAGCGSSGDGSAFGSSGSGNGDNLTSGTGSDNGGFGSSGGDTGGDNGSSGGGAGDVGSVTPGSACATSSAGVTAPPIYLVFMFDRSGSMGGTDLGVKWTPAVAAMKTFFSDSASSNIHASLQFFAPVTGNMCSASSYATPSVSMMALPDTTHFGAALDGTSPGGNTPTLPAETAAVTYAQSVAAGLKNGEKVAIVLVTDGDPNGCSSTPANVAAEAATVVSTIKTYVVGVGNDTTNLDTIAAGGGTSPHIQVNTASAATTTSDLQKAIGQIKAAELGCNYTLPPPPAGQTLDVNAVNVDYTPAGKAAQTLAYSADCSDPNGWHYDNAAAPTQILMCSDVCKTLQGDTTGGKVDIIFGCSTNVQPGGSPPN